MESSVEATATPHAILDVEVRMLIPVPAESFKGYLDGEPTLDSIQDLRVDELRDVLLEDTDRLFDAMTERLESTDDFIDIAGVEDIEDREPPKKVGLYRPDADTGGLYTLPVPNMISGNVVFTENGIEPVEVSNVNKLTDDQLEGAYYAVKRVWGLRGMHRYQKEQIAEFLSELEWAMLARPSRHVFRTKDDARPESLDAQQPLTCSYCGQMEEGHLVREEDANAPG